MVALIFCINQQYPISATSSEWSPQDYWCTPFQNQLILKCSRKCLRRATKMSIGTSRSIIPFIPYTCWVSPSYNWNYEAAANPPAQSHPACLPSGTVSSWHGSGINKAILYNASTQIFWAPSENQVVSLSVQLHPSEAVSCTACLYSFLLF